MMLLVWLLLASVAVCLHVPCCTAAAGAAAVVDGASAARDTCLVCCSVSCYRPALLFRATLIIALHVAATVAVAAAQRQ